MRMDCRTSSFCSSPARMTFHPCEVVLVRKQLHEVAPGMPLPIWAVGAAEEDGGLCQHGPDELLPPSLDFFDGVASVVDLCTDPLVVVDCELKGHRAQGQEIAVHEVPDVHWRVL